MDIQFILRTLVYAQSFLWLFVLFNDNLVYFLYDKEIQVTFVFYSLSMYSYVIYNDISFSQYPSELLGLYILMVLLCYGFFSTKFYTKDAIALSFLIVFINSYYWESMHHLTAIVLYGFNFNQFIQMFHLIPAYFLVKRLEFYNPKKVIKWLYYGLVVSALQLSSLHILFELFGNSMYIVTTPLTRMITLGILITIMLNEIKSIKKEKGIVNYT